MLLFEKIKGWLLAAAGVIIAILSALVIGYRKGNKAGATDVEAKASQATNEAVEQKNKIESEVQLIPTGQAQKKLQDEWSRE